MPKSRQALDLRRDDRDVTEIMIRPDQHEAVQPAFGIRSTDLDLIEELERRLALEFGEVIESTRPLELGPAELSGPFAEGRAPWVYKQWIATGETYPPEHLVAVKLHTLRVEALYTDAAGQPRVRIEPVYLDRRRVVKTRAEDAPHRLALGQGVYGEIMLTHPESGGFDPPPWSPPEDRRREVLDFFDRVYHHIPRPGP